jgi:hypothetical protein
MPAAPHLPVPTLPVPRAPDRLPATIAALPKEETWLQSRAYRSDVAHFLRMLAIATPAELRQVDHKAVIVCERFMARPRALRRPRSAGSSPRCRVCSSTWSATVNRGPHGRRPAPEPRL